jgi:hypothetical protein
MEIKITGSAKEIADLVLEIQGRQELPLFQVELDGEPILDRRQENRD